MGAIRLPRLSLGHRLLLALGAMLLPVVAVGVAGLLALHAADRDIDGVTGAFAREASLLGEVSQDLGRAESGAVRYVQLGDRQARADFFATGRRLREGLSSLERLGGAEERALARRARRSWRNARAIAVPLLQRPWRAPGNRSAYPLREFHPAVEQARIAVGAASELARRDAMAATAASNSREERILAVFLAIFVFGAGPAAFIGSRIHRSIERPAARLKDAAERLGAGDHLSRVELEPGDELGEVAAAFNATVEKVAASEEMLRRASKQDAVGQLASGIEQPARGDAQQRALRRGSAPGGRSRSRGREGDPQGRRAGHRPDAAVAQLQPPAVCHPGGARPDCRAAGDAAAPGPQHRGAHRPGVSAGRGSPSGEGGPRPAGAGDPEIWS